MGFRYIYNICTYKATMATHHHVRPRAELRLLRAQVPGPAHDEAGGHVGELRELLEHQVRLHGQLPRRGDNKDACFSGVVGFWCGGWGWCCGWDGDCV